MIRDGPLAAVRRRIASEMLGRPSETPAVLGSIRLRPRQQISASRVLSLLRAHRGALLADPVGLGKTYVALAVAREYAGCVLAVPASLRAMWDQACAAAGVRAPIISHEALSRRDAMQTPPLEAGTLLIVDEAHRLRNPRTRRYARVMALCRDSPVLLISATPLQNTLNDLAAPLALFLGSTALGLDASELARYVVRDLPAGADALPELRGPVPLAVNLEETIPRRLAQLPPPVPACDEGVAGALMRQLLVRRWTSSQAALVETLRRMLARAGALHDATLIGRALSRDDLKVWEHADDAVQLALPDLFGVAVPAAEWTAVDCARALETHMDAVRTLLRDLARACDADSARADMVNAIRARHPGERIIAFSQYARTIQSLFRHCAPLGRVAALTASGARTVTGSIAREAVLAQFAPLPAPPRAHGAERIDLLLATDLLSEGLNLQEASVVVHLDLPWNPARLEQRVGRVRRLGSRHQAVWVYTLQPTGARAITRRVDAALRRKLRAARTTIGVAGPVMPGEPDGHSRKEAAAEAMGRINETLRAWSREVARNPEQDGRARVAGVAAAETGWLCAYATGGATALVASIGGRISQEPSDIRHALIVASGAPAPRLSRAGVESWSAVRQWLEARRAARAVDLRSALTSRARRDLLARLAASVSAAAPHRRATVTAMAERARRAATMQLSAGAERALHQLVRSPLNVEEWLHSVEEFVAANSRGVTRAAGGQDQARIIGIIVFVPPGTGAPGKAATS